MSKICFAFLYWFKKPLSVELDGGKVGQVGKISKFLTKSCLFGNYWSFFGNFSRFLDPFWQFCLLLPLFRYTFKYLLFSAQCRNTTFSTSQSGLWYPILVVSVAHMSSSFDFPFISLVQKVWATLMRLLYCKNAAISMKNVSKCHKKSKLDDLSWVSALIW